MPTPPRYDLRKRLVHLWWLKAFGNTVFMYLFFTIYFHVLRHPAYPVFSMPLTWLDTQIPYHVVAFGIYVSLWVYTALPVALQPNFWQLIYYGASIISMCAAGLVFFYFWPSVVPDGFQSLGGQRADVLQGLDAPGNACPSLHVASAVFSAWWLRAQLKEMFAHPLIQFLNIAWCIAIVYSTLATKQHVFLDVLAGSVLGGAWALLSLWGLRWLVRKYPGIASA